MALDPAPGESIAQWNTSYDPDDLPKLTNKALLTRYRGRVDAAKRWREDKKYDKTWKRLRDIYRFKMLQGIDEQDAIGVAIAFATINVIAPSVAVNHPKITVNAQYPADEDKATITEAVINYWWRHYHIQPEFRRSVKDFLIYGHGWLKVGYRYEEQDRPLGTDAQGQQVQDLTTQAGDFAEANPELASQVPTNEDIAANAPQYETVAVEDRPFVERVSPFDIYVDPEATSMEDACWIAQKFCRPLEEVKRDKRYKNTSNLESDGSTAYSDNEKGAPSTVKEDNQRITLWEFYDIKRGEVSVFCAAGGDKFLVDPRPFDYPYGAPFVQLRNYDVPDTFYPVGEIEAIEPLQDELNQTRTMMVIARKQDIPKYLYRKDSFDATALDALASDEPNTAIPVRDELDFAQVLAPVPQNTRDAQFYAQHSEVIENDIDRVTGVSEYQRGEIPETRRTATEASIIQDAANARVADKLALIENAIGDVAKRLVQLAQKYMSTEQVVRVTGSNGKMWVPFNSEDITGEFDFDVEAGSTQPINDTFKKQQALQMSQTMAPFIGAVIDPAKMATYILREGYGIKNPEQFLMPPPDPNAASKPSDKLIETLAYKDTPPDIQRQIEAQAGLQPSVIGGSSPVEGGVPSPGADPNAGPPNPNAPNDPSGPAGAQLEGQVGLQQDAGAGRDGANGGGALGPGAAPTNG